MKPSFLDTSTLVRYLLGLPEAMAERARSLIDSDRLLYLTGIVIAETAFVLTSFYKLPRETVIERLIECIQRENITTFGMEKALTVTGLSFCRPSGRISVPDALIWAAARSAGDSIVYTFDRRFPSEGIELRSPGEGSENRSDRSQENGEST